MIRRMQPQLSGVLTLGILQGGKKGAVQGSFLGKYAALQEPAVAQEVQVPGNPRSQTIQLRLQIVSQDLLPVQG